MVLNRSNFEDGCNTIIKGYDGVHGNISNCLLYTSSVHVPRKLKEMIHLSVPEALVEVDRNEFCFSGVDNLSRFQAVGIGSGIGTSPVTAEGIRQLLSVWRGKIVLDADALNSVSYTHLDGFSPKYSGTSAVCLSSLRGDAENRNAGCCSG